MKLFPSISAAAAVLVGMSLVPSFAVAQDADTPAPPTVIDEPAPTLWQPGDGRPPWAKSDDPATGPISNWAPGDGQPPWAKGPDHGPGGGGGGGAPDVDRGRPAWAGGGSDTQGENHGRRGQNETRLSQSGRDNAAPDKGNRGRGRNH
ncbi:MAG: hypothetical protein ACT4N2_02990 [Hyphomicrobium sp.]